MSFNSSNCAISGTPRVVQSSTPYLITASNSAGIVKINITITIIYIPYIAKPTGLLWQRCSADQNEDATCSGIARGYTFDGAKSYCNSLMLAGKTWRLPNLEELKSLVDSGMSSSPSIDTTAFPNTLSAGYWSSRYSDAPFDNAWYINFNGGGVNFGYMAGNAYVRCVAGP
jgi:hypothetical protein